METKMRNLLGDLRVIQTKVNEADTVHGQLLEITIEQIERVIDGKPLDKRPGVLAFNTIPPTHYEVPGTIDGLVEYGEWLLEEVKGL